MLYLTSSALLFVHEDKLHAVLVLLLVYLSDSKFVEAKDWSVVREGSVSLAIVEDPHTASIVLFWVDHLHASISTVESSKHSVSV